MNQCLQCGCASFSRLCVACSIEMQDPVFYGSLGIQVPSLLLGGERETKTRGGIIASGLAGREARKGGSLGGGAATITGGAGGGTYGAGGAVSIYASNNSLGAASAGVLYDSYGAMRRDRAVVSSHAPAELGFAPMGSLEQPELLAAEFSDDLDGMDGWKR